MCSWSKAGAAHLFVFGPPTPWQQVQTYGELVVAEAGLGVVEIFPKGEGLNGVKMPGSRHPKSGLLYPAIDPATGELVDVRRALLAIRPQPFPVLNLQRGVPPIAVPTCDSGGFWALVQELSKLTRVRVFGREKTVGCCPWHNDRHPSLFVKGNRFHCLAASCGCWGDITDVQRYIERGTFPPRE